MNFDLLNKILKNGEEIDIYKIKSNIYHKILYNDVIYTILENNKGIKLEESERGGKDEPSLSSR